MAKHIAVVGTGLVGSAWAIVFARAGHDVVLFDEEAEQCERAIARIETNVSALKEHGLIDDPAEHRVIGGKSPVPGDALIP